MDNMISSVVNAIEDALYIQQSLAQLCQASISYVNWNLVMSI